MSGVESAESTERAPSVESSGNMKNNDSTALVKQSTKKSDCFILACCYVFVLGLGVAASVFLMTKKYDKEKDNVLNSLSVKGTAILLTVMAFIGSIYTVKKTHNFLKKCNEGQ